MPLSDEEERVFQELRRRRDREYAKIRRDKTRKKKYGERTTRKINNDIAYHLLTLSKVLTPSIITKTKELQTQKRKRKSSIEK
jgi:hypothetical protein